jgi:hypothetical protein
LKQLTPEEKVKITANMTNAITNISLEGIKINNPDLSEEETIQILRERTQKRRR